LAEQFALILDFESALVTFERLKRLVDDWSVMAYVCSRNASVATTWANILLQQKQYDQAMKYFDLAFSLGYPKGYINLKRAQCMILKNNVEMALNYIQMVIETNPSFTGSYLIRGNLNMSMNKPILVKNDIEILEKIDPLLPDLKHLKAFLFACTVDLKNLCYAEMKRKKYDSALYYINQAHLLSENDWRIKMVRGFVNFEMQKWDQSLQDLKCALLGQTDKIHEIEIKSKIGHAHNKKGLALCTQNEYRQAIDEFTKALEFTNNDCAILENRAGNLQ
jgi:tetratricopeptide (TPR) repeat protein